MTKSELEYQIGEAKAEAEEANSKLAFLEQQLEEGDYEEDE